MNADTNFMAETKIHSKFPMLLLLSHFSRVRFCVTPWTAAISFSNAWKWKVKVKSLSHVLLFATPWTAAYQAPPSMGFSRQEYWSGVPSPSPKIALRQV